MLKKPKNKKNSLDKDCMGFVSIFANNLSRRLHPRFRRACNMFFGFLLGVIKSMQRHLLDNNLFSIKLISYVVPTLPSMFGC